MTEMTAFSTFYKQEIRFQDSLDLFGFDSKLNTPQKKKKKNSTSQLVGNVSYQFLWFLDFL